MKERENLRNNDHGSGLAGIVDGIRGVFRRKPLKGLEETFRTIAEQSPNMIFINCMGRVVYANERCRDIMGYSKAEFYSEDFDFLTLIAPESRELVSANFRRHLAGEDLAPYEYALITKDNTRIDVIITTKIMDYDGERALLGIITDISERKRAEAEIRRRLEFEKTVAAISSHFVGISDTDQAIDTSLGEMGRVCGADRVYIFHFDSDLTVMDNTHEWCSEGVKPQIENLQKLPTESFPWWMATLENNRIIHVDDVSNLPQEAESEKGILEGQGIKSLIVLPLLVKGKLSGFVGFDNVVSPGKWSDEDVSLLRLFSEILSSTFERQWAERALRENEEKYRQLVEYAPTGIYEVDLGSGKFLSVNDVMCEYLGYTREELMEKNPVSLLADEEGRRQQAERMAKLAAGEDVPETAEYRIRTKDGRNIWSLTNVRLRCERGKSPIAQVVAHDITDRKKIEAEREALISELETKNSELERFTYTVSHDLKSPLITIQGFLGLLEKDLAAGDPERIEADMSRIGTAADKMQQLLAELLELLRIGRMPGVMEEIKFFELAKEAAAMVEGRRKERKTVLEIPETPVLIKGDRTRLREVLENLLDNAIKFMGEQREPKVEIGVRRDGQQKVFYVKDNGVGIDARHHQQIFGLFTKLDSESDGSGMGLAIVTRILEMQGGRIWVESEGCGRGSVFCFTLE